MKARPSQSVEYIDLKHINLIETKHNVEIWPEIRNIMLRGRFAKKKKKKDASEKVLSFFKLVWGLWEDFGSAWASGWCTELTNALPI